jgi:hypothetical protein
MSQPAAEDDPSAEPSGSMSTSAGICPEQAGPSTNGDVMVEDSTTRPSGPSSSRDRGKRPMSLQTLESLSKDTQMKRSRSVDKFGTLVGDSRE